jgi:Fe-S-cluster containining protein
MALHEQTRLRFACSGCGACCSGGPDYHVYLDPREAERIRRHLGLSGAWFRRRYLRRTSEGELILSHGGADRCVFLRPDNRCGIYPVRPLQCRTYPFWPEIMRSRAAWRREALRCEGIDRVAVVPLAKIRAALARHKKEG